MPHVTDINAYCSKRKGRYWVHWRENGIPRKQDYASSTLARMHVTVLKGIQNDQVIAERTK